MSSKDEFVQVRIKKGTYNRIANVAKYEGITTTKATHELLELALDEEYGRMSSWRVVSDDPNSPKVTIEANNEADALSLYLSRHGKNMSLDEIKQLKVERCDNILGL